jgi:Na+/melibiose symporter-like transporter
MTESIDRQKGPAGPVAPGDPGRERLPFSTRCLYGFGSVSEGIKATAFNTFLLFYYNQVLGLPGTLGGLAILLALAVDAITDPLMGSISDNFHSRWGRRHPFMYAGALPMAACFFLLFNPPASLGRTELFFWLTAFAVLVRVSMTLYAIPSNSMVAEMTPHYDERTSLVSYRFFFGWAGGITMYQVALRVFLTETPEFGDGRYNADGYGGFALAGALGIAAAILICAVGTHRLIPTLKPPPEKTPLTLARFFRELREVFGNHSYLMLVFAGLFSAVAGGYMDVVGLYMSTYFWGFDAQEIAFLGLAAVPAFLLAVGLARPISERFDKRKTALGVATFAVLFGSLPVFLRLADLMPPNGHPLLLYLIFGHNLLILLAVIIIGIVIASMIADTIDVGELRTGKRQEGMYSSAIAFTVKAVSGVGGFLAGVALDLVDFPTNAMEGAAPDVTEEKIFALGAAVAPVLVVLYLCALIFLSRYRITREHHAETLSELERRRLEQD